MIGKGIYVIEYYYKDARGHCLTKRETRGTFDLVIELYDKLHKMMENNEKKAPDGEPKLYQVVDGYNKSISYKKEYEEWKGMKSSTK